MKDPTRLVSGWTLFGILAVFAGWLSAFPILANAQGGQGQNAVYPTSGTCCVGSKAFVDASMFTTNSSNNFCAVLNFVLNPLNGIVTSAGAVIDARGLPGAMGTSMKCTTANPSPWAGIANPPPSVILLPAGTIVIPGTWVLPNNTRLIGEGDALNNYRPPSKLAVGTTLQACKQSVK
jgi:hypothetical protein